MKTDAAEMTDNANPLSQQKIEADLQSARTTARYSVGVALVSLVGAIASGWFSYQSSNDVAVIDSRTRNEVALIDSSTSSRIASLNTATARSIEAIRAELKRGDQAIHRAATVASQFEILLREGSAAGKRVAFLNLWQLYSDEKDRQVVILAALQYGDDDVFDLLLLLEREVAKHKDLVRDLTQHKECRKVAGDSRNDCGLTERAKQLYAKLDPSGAVDLLLEEMNGYPLTSPDDANLDYLRELVAADPALIAMLEKDYDARFPKRAGLSYVLYGYDSKERFRGAISDSVGLSEQDKWHLVEFLSGWPMRDIDDEDWPRVAKFLGDLLPEVRAKERWPVMKPLLRTIKKVKFKSVQDAEIRNRIRDDVAALVSAEDVLWPIRSEASRVLLKIDQRRLFDALRDVAVEPGSNVAKEFGRILYERRKNLAAAVAVAAAPAPETEEFAVWQDWLREYLR